MGVVRDFSQSSIESIREIIRENVDEEDQWAIVDWFDDFFTNDVNINDYIDSVAEYQAIMVDKHDISSNKFDEILEKIQTVDYNYSGRLESLYTRLSEFYTKIIAVSAMISPEALEMDPSQYEAFLETIHNEYDKAAEQSDRDIEEYENSMPRLDDPEWYEKLYNAAVGVVTSTAVDTYEGTLLSVGFVSHLVTGQLDKYDDYVSQVENSTEGLENLVIDYAVTDEESYYFGRCAGDVVMLVAGAKGIADGGAMIVGAAAEAAEGVAVGATGVGAPVGVALEGVAVGELVLGGAIALEGAGVVCASISNFQNNLDHFNSAGSSTGSNSTEKPSSVKLRRNLKKAGVSTPDYPNAAHHIVAGNASSPSANKARQILEKFKIGINEADNGVFLPTAKGVSNSAYHPSLHTDAYYRKVYELLAEAESREDVLDTLSYIAEELMNGTFMK